MKVREKYGLNIVLFTMMENRNEINPQYRFKCDDTIAVVGREEKGFHSSLMIIRGQSI